MSYGGKSAGSGPSLSTDLRNASGGWGQIGGPQQQATFQSGVANPPRPAGASLFNMPSISNTPGTPGYGAPADQSLNTQMAQPIGLPNGQQLNIGQQQAQPAQSLFGQQPTAQNSPQAAPPPMTPGFNPGDTFGGGLAQTDPATGMPYGQTILGGPFGGAPGLGNPPRDDGLQMAMPGGPNGQDVHYGDLQHGAPGQGPVPMPAPITQPIMRSQPQPVGAGLVPGRSIGAIQAPVQPAQSATDALKARLGLTTPAGKPYVAAKPAPAPARPSLKAPMPTRSTKGYVSRLGK